MSDPLNNLGSIWYHSKPSDFPYSPNQFLGWDFFAAFYSKTVLCVTFNFDEQDVINFTNFSKLTMKAEASEA